MSNQVIELTLILQNYILLHKVWTFPNSNQCGWLHQKANENKKSKVCVLITRADFFFFLFFGHTLKTFLDNISKTDVW